MISRRTTPPNTIRRIAVEESPPFLVVVSGDAGAWPGAALGRAGGWTDGTAGIVGAGVAWAGGAEGTGDAVWAATVRTNGSESAINAIVVGNSLRIEVLLSCALSLSLRGGESIIALALTRPHHDLGPRV
jgi:hypothetical protein